MPELDPVVQKFIADLSAYGRNVEAGTRQVDHFGDRNSAAALAARKMELAAKEAGETAARSMRTAAEGAEIAQKAQEAAAEAAEKLARGEIAADEAAQAEARALEEAARAADAQTRAQNDLERANIRSAESSLAAGRAANDQAEQYRQVAREAEVAAGVQQLAWLKANGTAEQHNQLLGKIRKDYGELGRSATADMKELENAEAQAAEAGSMMGPLIVGAIALIPPAATLVAGALTLGLGGALAGLGLKATMGSEEAQTALNGLKDHASAVMDRIDKPWEATWVAMADGAKSALDGIAPSLENVFAKIAPEVSAFMHTLGSQLPGALDGLLNAVDRDFGPIVSELGATLPDALKRVADGLAQIMDEAAQHPQIFGDLITGLSKIVEGAAYAVVALEKIMEAAEFLAQRASDSAQGLERLGTAFEQVGGIMSPVGLIIDKIGEGLGFLSGTARGTVPDIREVSSALADSAAQSAALASAQDDAKSAMDLASESADQLKASLDALTGKTLDEREATEAAAKAWFKLTNDIKENGAAHGLATEAGVKNEQALTKFAAASLTAAEAMKKDGESAQAVAMYMAGTRQEVYLAALKMGYSATQADALATKLTGISRAAAKIPKTITTTVHANTATAEAALQRLLKLEHDAAQGVPSAGIANLGQRKAHGGPVLAFAAGGRYPDGGAVHGRGTSTSDEINVHLSTGEFVVNAASYAANAGLVTAINAAKGAYLPADPYKESVLAPGRGHGPYKTLPAYAPPMGAAHRSYAETLNGGSGGSSRPIVQNSNVYVAGSVWSEQELASVIQRVFLNNGWSLTMPAGR